MAQLVARPLWEREVASSSLASPTKTLVIQLKLLACLPVGSGVLSRNSHGLNSIPSKPCFVSWWLIKQGVIVGLRNTPSCTTIAATGNQRGVPMSNAIIVQVRIPSSIGARYDELAKQTGRTRPYYVNEALQESIDRLEYEYGNPQTSRGLPCRTLRDSYTRRTRGTPWLGKLS